MLNITVNGHARSCEPGSTVSDLLSTLGLGPAGSAVAINGEVLARGAWPEHPVRDGDRVDVLTAVQGG